MSAALLRRWRCVVRRCVRVRRWRQPRRSRACCASAPTPTTCRSRTSDGSGFENRIAELRRRATSALPLQYAWLPQRRGFVRKTLGAGLCDVIIGVPAGFERALTTRAVLPLELRRSSPRRRADGARVASTTRACAAAHRRAAGRRRLAATPPGACARAPRRRSTNVVGFPVYGDEPGRPQRMVDAVARGDARRRAASGARRPATSRGTARAPLRVHAAARRPPTCRRCRSTFAIAMGVRRSDDGAARRARRRASRGAAPTSTRILDDYGVPRCGRDATPASRDDERRCMRRIDVRCALALRCARLRARDAPLHAPPAANEPRPAPVARISATCSRALRAGASAAAADAPARTRTTRAP